MKLTPENLLEECKDMAFTIRVLSKTIEAQARRIAELEDKVGAPDA